MTEKKKSERHLLDAVLTNSEVLVDSLTDNPAVAAIPVIGTAIKVCKAIDDMRARAFAKKLADFIEDPALRSNEAAEKIKRKISTDPDEATKVGETLFLVLDRFIDLDKPAVLARCYVAYLDDIISAEVLQRLAAAIDTAFAADLKRFMTEELDEYEDRRPWMANLVPSGLTYSTVRPMPPIKTEFSPTPLGRSLWTVWRHVPL